MEFFIHNLDYQVSDDDLKSFLARLLASNSLYTFDIRKTRKKGCAIMTIADVTKAQHFLALYNRDASAPCYRLMGKQISFSISRNLPDPWLVKVLQKKESDRVLRLQSKWKPNKQPFNARSDNANLNFQLLSCGRWEARGLSLRYVEFSTTDTSGIVIVDRSSLMLTLDWKKDTTTMSKYEVVMEFYDILSIAVNPVARPTFITITLGVAPKVYVSDSNANSDLNLQALLAALLGDQRGTDSVKYRSRELGNISLKVENGVDILEEIKTKSLGAAPLLHYQPQQTFLAKKALDDQILQLDRRLARYKTTYGLRFQLQRLWTNTYLSPHEVSGLLDCIMQVKNRSGDDVAVQAVRRMSNQIPYAGPEVDPGSLNSERVSELITQAEESILTTRTHDVVSKTSRTGGIQVHKVTVTPTGIYLEGPDEESSNRVLRKYSDHADHFLRVTFVEENGERIAFNREYSNKRIFCDSFQPILRHGVDIGFSHSSLRSQTCWFMAPFHFNYELLTAATVIESLGDFSHIRSPAKCAARIGQAFSDTQCSITIDRSYVTNLAEVTRNDYVFSDGVGTFSPKLWSLIRKQNHAPSRTAPTAYQVRYGGAKGMISLDSRLHGHKLCLRPSMIKYEGSNFSDIEICGSASQPLPMRLNRQLIKLLEDLGIESGIFEKLQQIAIQKLRASASSSRDASAFLQESLANGRTQFPWLLKKLEELEIDATEEAFILDILSALIHVELKELKYRARIPVAKAVTLYGIMDETNFLQEGQIYCTFSEGHQKYVLSGCVAVTRSPALHPGDVQIANATAIANDSPLASLRNCVVFSSQGERDLPSQLSGGDLDGDLYNIIYSKSLIPKVCMPAADYSRALPQDIGRQVTAHDMADFFLDFMENDQLGRIATLHQVLADQFPEGTKSPDCLKLAALHSTAVDFSKTGIPVNLKEIPRSPIYRPDFMAPGPNTKIEKGILVRDIAREADPDEVKGKGYRYYASEKTLGILYRAVDEEAFFEALEDDASSVFSRGSQCSVLEQIWQYVGTVVPELSWRKHLKAAEEIRDCYDSSVIDSMLEYAFHRCNHLSEIEVFLGTIIGKNGARTSRQREQAIVMKERFGREVQDVNAWIRNGYNDDYNDGNNDNHHVYSNTDALERAMACLYIGKKPRNDTTNRVDVQLVSFGWIVAATCLQEVE